MLKSKSFFTRHKTGLAGLAAPGWFFRILWRRYRGKSWISTLWGFFAGQYLNLALAALVFVVKASPVWVWPVVTRNILNALSPVRPDSLDAIRVNILVMLVLILQNIPLHTLHRKALRVDLVNSVFGSSVWVCFQLFNLICIGVAAWMAVKGSIQAGDVVMYLGYFGMMVGSINGLVDFYPTLCLGRESLRSLSEILECPDLESNQGKRQVREVEGRIVLDRVEYRYAPDLAPAVQDVTLDIKPGESVAFVGESGSGKSTLMNLVIGFRRPTGGRILLDGSDMETLDMRTYRHYLAVVAQNTILFSGTVRENITYGLDRVDDKRLQEVLELANVSQFVRELPKGLDTVIGEHGGRLSGGQRQRISIARAFIREPRVIVLDEATSALDVVSEKLVQEAIQRLISRRTTLIVAHRLSTIRNADRVVVMKQGRIVEQGTHDKLMIRQGEFFRMVNLQR